MNIYYREDEDRWVRGDRFVRPAARKLLRRNPPFESGMQLVVRNFLYGLKRRGIHYRLNPVSFRTSRTEPVISFGRRLNGLKGIARETPVIAAVGFPHPADLPNLCNEYNIRKYLQHSQWVLDLTRDQHVYDESIFDLWPAGVDTDAWAPSTGERNIDLLVYDKILFERERYESELLKPLRETLNARGYVCFEVRYGHYTPAEYRDTLARARAMIFLSASETQGFASLEALACDVPVFAWNQGYWLDPDRFRFNQPVVRATSVPFFDERCGATFADVSAFDAGLGPFMENVQARRYSPREFVIERVSIDRSTQRMLEIYGEVSAGVA